MMDWKEEEYVSWKPTNNDAHDSIKGTSFLTKCLIPRVLQLGLLYILQIIMKISKEL